MSERLFQKRSLGQVFLKVDWPVERMAAQLRELGVEHALEIGPGPGNLTRALLDQGLTVTAIEKDARFAARLQEQRLERLTVVEADVLKFDLGAWAAGAQGRPAVVGNIPYNISSPIALKALEQIDALAVIMLMTQKEFARRVAAEPGTKDYGSLTVYSQLRADVELEFDVPRGCFAPVPKVDSAVMTLRPKADRLPASVLEKVEQVTRSAFQQRRKMLRNSVKPFLEAAGKPEAACPIDLDRRADVLTPAEFVALAAFLVD